MFVHRIGRTARMGRSGYALLLLADHEDAYVGGSPAPSVLFFCCPPCSCARGRKHQGTDVFVVSNPEFLDISKAPVVHTGNDKLSSFRVPEGEKENENEEEEEEGGEAVSGSKTASSSRSGPRSLSPLARDLFECARELALRDRDLFDKVCSCALVHFFFFFVLLCAFVCCCAGTLEGACEFARLRACVLLCLILL